MESGQDRWSQWLGSRRDGGDPRAREATLQSLAVVRDRVLDAAGQLDGLTVLDVGCGEGLIGRASLDRVGANGRVIFADISKALIDHLEHEAQQDGWSDRADFVLADAEDLKPIADSSIDVVMTRSVLIYVADKATAFRAMHRVLRPGGRISLFEPINRLQYPEPEDRFLGYDVSAVQDFATRVKEERFDPADPAAKAIIDFDDRDLVTYASAAGFSEVSLTLEVKISSPPAGNTDFDVILKSAPNPLSPTLGESIDRALSAAEAEAFVDHMRKAVASSVPVKRTAVAYLTARRAE